MREEKRSDEWSRGKNLWPRELVGADWRGAREHSNSCPRDSAGKVPLFSSFPRVYESGSGMFHSWFGRGRGIGTRVFHFLSNGVDHYILSHQSLR